MLVNQPALDYLRVGTWDHMQTYWWHNLIGEIAKSEGGNPETGKWMQYRGVKHKGAFAGHARQGPDKHLHTLIQISGESAERYKHEVRALADKGGGKATRVDVQVTIPMSANPWRARAWADHLRRAEWGHRRPGITAIDGELGMDTLYIGSRTSERYIRFYVKDGSEGGLFLRYEIEYKGEKAQDAWNKAPYTESLRRLLGGELDRLPLPATDPDLQALQSVLFPGNAIPTLTVGSGGKTWHWLLDAVDPALKRMLADHEYGAQTRELLAQWQDFADNLDLQQ